MDLNIDTRTGYPKGFDVKGTEFIKAVEASSLSCFAIVSPHNNCQTFSIGTLDSVFIKYQTNLRTRTKSTDPFLFDYESIAYTFLKFQKTCEGKHQVLLDIHDFDYYHQVIDEIFKDNIVIKAPYVSTNNTKMCIYLLKLQGAKNYIENIEKTRAIEKKRLADEEKARKIASGEWKEPECTLPEKWYIITTEENNNLVLNWHFEKIKITKTDYYDRSIGNYITNEGNGWIYSIKGREESHMPKHIEITTEQFEKYVLNKDTFVIPEKWYVELTTTEEDKVITDYFNKKLNRRQLVLRGDKQIFYNESGEYYYPGRFNNNLDSLKNDRELITFDQFKEHILNKEEFVSDNTNLPF
jgi:hypothetical protein